MRWKGARPFSPDEAFNLIRLWPTAMTDKEMAEVFGRHRGVLARKAAELGLPGRRVARQRALSEQVST